MPRGAKPKVYPAEIVEAVASAYAAGASQEEVAAELGLTRKVVWRLMQRHELPRRPPIKRDQHGENNSTWRGPKAKYAALHYRVEAARGKPSRCEECGTTTAKRFEWASLTKNYADVNDYRRLCTSCHKRFDRIVLNLGAYAVRKEASQNA